MEYSIYGYSAMENIEQLIMQPYDKYWNLMTATTVGVHVPNFFHNMVGMWFLHVPISV